MPVRKRVSKTRLDDLPARGLAFTCGRDYFDDLERAGVRVDSYGRPKREDAEAAWQRLGAAFLQQYHDPYVVPWALTEFGQPGARRRRG